MGRFGEHIAVGRVTNGLRTCGSFIDACGTLSCREHRPVVFGWMLMAESIEGERNCDK